MDGTISWFVFLMGAIFGSFLNVCIYRMPLDLSIVRPRSFCPQCKKQIPWYENVPLLSFLMLGGKCRRCKTVIPVRYFMIELTSALMWWFLWKQFGLTVGFASAVVFFSMLLVTIVTDFETGLIPDLITFPGMAAGLVFSLFGSEHFSQGIWYQRLFSSLLGLLAGGGILYLTGWFGKLVFRKDSMGGGDVKLLAMIGTFVGPANVFFIFLMAPFPALPFAIWQRFVNKEETIPFGPFLALAGAFFFMQKELIINLLSKMYGI